MKWIDRLFGGPTDMAALTAGKQAPEISLPAVDGNKFSWQDALKKGPVVAAFFKVSCPVCQYAFPFLERLHKAYGDQKITIVGVSQDDATKTKAFMNEYGVTFPVLLDDPNGYAISNAYGLTNVPSVFFIAPDGEIELSSVGWVKKDIEQLNRKLADVGKSAAKPLFKPGEDVRDFRAG
jgi:peroxiredoxin